MGAIGFILYFGLCYFIAAKIGSRKKIGFWKTFLLCIVTSPFFGFMFAENSKLKNPKGCNWCGNKYNEAIYCGLCGKNEEGEIRPGFVKNNR
jgi:hypothetical protein